MPVNIVPRTVTLGVNAIVASSQAVSGLAMLNPQRWTGPGSRPTSTEETPEDRQVLQEKVTDLQVPTSISTRPPNPSTFDQLQMLVSLDTSLELIQADRDALKRCETFASYPGKYGHKVRDAIEEIFIFMLKAAGDRHIAPGFRM